MDATASREVIRIDYVRLAERLGGQQGRITFSETDAVIWLLGKGFRVRGSYWIAPNADYDGLPLLLKDEIAERLPAERRPAERA